MCICGQRVKTVFRDMQTLDYQTLVIVNLNLERRSRKAVFTAGKG